MILSQPGDETGVSTDRALGKVTEGEELNEFLAQR